MSDYTLHHGDMFDVLPTLVPGSVAMVVADLPYGAGHTLCAWDKAIDLTIFWPALWKVCARRALVCATASQPFTTTLINSQSQSFKYCLVWDKKFAGSPATARYRPLRVHEDICVFYRQKGCYNPQMVLRDKPIQLGGNRCASPSAPFGSAKASYVKKIYSHKHPVTVLQFSSRIGKRGLHPTQKPVALLEWLIATYTNPGDLVLDPCFGSNTTGVACARLGRRYIGIEKDAGYFAAGKARLEREVEALRTGPAQGRLAV